MPVIPEGPVSVKGKVSFWPRQLTMREEVRVFKNRMIDMGLARIGLIRASRQIAKVEQMSIVMAEGEAPFISVVIGQRPHQTRFKGWIHPTPHGPISGPLMHAENPVDGGMIGASADVL